ncbi:glutamate/aspartate import solute-binding protein [Rhodobiaceae bacterium]|nr:glutamate/aspartate import solute-binding protein [Rhodobiaceae bacterium]
MQSFSKATRVGAALLTAATVFFAGSIAHAGPMERISDTGVIKIGFREDAYPFSYRNQDGDPAGYTVEVCREIAATVEETLALVDLNIEYVPVSAANRFEAVTNGQVDLLCGATTKRLSLREIVSFSLPIFETGIAAMVQPSASSRLRDAINDVDAFPGAGGPARDGDYAGIVMATRASTTAADWLPTEMGAPEGGAKVTSVESHDEGFQKLLSGDVDVYFADRAILLSLVVANQAEDKVIVGERLFSNEPYGLVFAKDDDAFRLLVDRSLIRLFLTDRISEIYSRYFGEADDDVRADFMMNTLPE